MCVVPCEEIPIFSRVRSAFDNPNAVEKKFLILPVFKIPAGIVTLNELSTRASLSDHRASDFLKDNKQILTDLDNDDPSIRLLLRRKALKPMRSVFKLLNNK